MKKCKLVSQVVAVIGILTLFVTLAHAGSGNGTGGGSTSSFIVCHGINGLDQGQHVDIYTDELGYPNNLSWQNVRVGSGVLACTPVRVAVHPSSFDGTNITGTEIVPGENAPNGTYLKCYTIAVPRTNLPAGRLTQFDFSDYFDPYPPGEIDQASTVQLLCAPANATLPQ